MDEDTKKLLENLDAKLKLIADIVLEEHMARFHKPSVLQRLLRWLGLTKPAP